MPWELRGYDEKGEQREISSYYPENGAENFRTRDVLAAVEDHLTLDENRFPLHLLRRETELSSTLSDTFGGLPWSDPIHRWGRTVPDSPYAKTDAFGELSFDGQAIVWQVHEPEGRCAVAHAPTFAVFAVTSEIETVDITWRPGEREFPHQFLPFFPVPDTRVSGQVFFDIRAYSGQHSSLRDGFIRARRLANDWAYRARLKLKGRVGFVVIKACLHVGGMAAAIRADPSQAARLQRLEAEYSQYASRIPDLQNVASMRGQSAVVFVHGTASCGILSVAPFDLKHLGNHDWYRFEHDTFLPVDTNATELAAKIRNRFAGKRLLLVGHSRGGLVARGAAAELKQFDVHVWTFGTPNMGTPLVQAAEGARRIVAATAAFGLGYFAFVPEWTLGLLLRLGSRVAKGIPIPDVQTAAWSFFLADRELPPGFSDMAKKSGWLSAVDRYDPVSNRQESAALAIARQNNALWPPGESWDLGNNHLRTYAGQFDESTSGKTGYSLMGGSAEAMFGPEGNDLVVSTDSATLNKYFRILSDCTHFDFFDEGSVQSDILSF